MLRTQSALGLLLAFGLGPQLLTFAGCSDSSDSSKGDTGTNAILFIKRQHTTVGADGVVTVDVAGGNGQVLDYERYVPGGSLVMLSPPRPDGTLKNITQDFPTADFNGADISFDGRQAVFSMKRDGQDHYHLYTAQLEEKDGKFEIHQKTAGDRDDINPVYIAGARIAFVTNQMYTPMGTRADEYEHGRVVTQLATISVEGGDADRRLASQNLSHTVAPFARADGKIGYSRWEHLGPVNDVKLFAANPDGTQMLAIAGQHGKPSNALFSVKEVSPNVMIGIGTSRNRTIHAGALIRIDARNQNDPVCLDPAADQTGHACVNEEGATFEVLTPDVPLGNEASPVGRYREPSVLRDGRILTSFAEGAVNDLAEMSATPPDFGIYIFNPTTKQNELVYNDRQTWDLNALAVAPHTEPPVIADSLSASADLAQPVRIGSVNIVTTSLKENVDGLEGAFLAGSTLDAALKEAKKVRVIEGFSSEGAKGVTMFGLTMEEGAAILGEAGVNPDGSWLAEIPPFVPVHLQPLDKFGMSIRSQRLWIQGMPGEDRRCVGCHETRTGATPPRFGATVAEQKKADNLFIPIDQRTEYPWATTTEYPASNPKNVIQTVLNTKCVQCHDGGDQDPFRGKTYTFTRTDPATGQATAYPIPYLDLSEKEIAVYYDRRVARYPSSYVSLFYPAAMEMGMGNTVVTGDVPPEPWAVPTNARRSALIRKVNLKAADGSLAFPGKPLHPEDKGVELSDEERAMFVRSIDLGGQFYARQNTGFQPFVNDPVSGTKY